MHSIIIQYSETINKDLMPKASQIRAWAKAALQHLKLAHEITIRLVDSEEITFLNQTYRKKSYATNVLSFPIDLPLEVKLAKKPLGDIAICADIVNQEAKDQSKAQAAHWAHIVIHGTFHLLGYDHEQEDDAILMETLEIETLKQLGFPNPYEMREE